MSAVLNMEIQTISNRYIKLSDLKLLLQTKHGNNFTIKVHAAYCVLSALRKKLTYLGDVGARRWLSDPAASEAE